MSVESSSKKPDVQSFTVIIERNITQGVMYLDGTFSLSFDGQHTKQLPYNASPELVEE